MSAPVIQVGPLGIPCNTARISMTTPIALAIFFLLPCPNSTINRFQPFAFRSKIDPFFSTRYSNWACGVGGTTTTRIRVLEN